MKIAIIGGGALGLLFSYYLNHDHQLTLYTRTKEQADRINSEGIHLFDGDQTHCQKVKAVQIDLWEGSCDLTFIAVKEHQLANLMPLLNEKIKSKTSSLFFLQNGMGHLKWLPTNKAERIYLGSVEHGAAKINENSVSHNGHSVTRVAIYKGSDDYLKQLLMQTSNQFPFVMERDYHEMLVNKLLVNAVINPLTATFQVTNGTLLTNPFFHKIACQLFDEVAAVLKIKNKEEKFRNVCSVCGKTATNRSSMLKDIEAGRKTEIDAILGYILEEAKREQLATPLLNNYYHAIKGKEYQRGGV